MRIRENVFYQAIATVGLRIRQTVKEAIALRIFDQVIQVFMQGFDIAYRYVLNYIRREEQIQRPAERDAELLFKTRQLQKIDAPPQKPSDEPGKLYAENIGDTSATANGGELAKRRE